MYKFCGKILLLFFSVLFSLPNQGQAYLESQWYIKDFQSEIQINQDSSLKIIEKIAADCPNCFDKHGIYRILPTRYSPAKNQYVNLPIKLISITDFKDQPIQYQEMRNYFDHTISWKIGDPHQEVRGINYYKIVYTVKNAIRFNNSEFEEFYWNLSGNHWDMPIDHYEAKIKLPTKLNKNQIKELNLYSGFQNSHQNDFTEFNWPDDQTLKVKTNRELAVGEGVTLSLTFLKDFFTPYQFSLLDLPFNFLYLILPLLVLFACIILWLYFGNDPKINPTIAPEFAPPENLKPIVMGLVLTDGQLRNNFISAAIISLAVAKVLKIEEVEGRGLFKKKDYQITLLDHEAALTPSENTLIEGLSINKSTPSILISELKNKFYTQLPTITKITANPCCHNNSKAAISCI